jgi:hypothetical protein
MSDVTNYTNQENQEFRFYDVMVEFMNRLVGDEPESVLNSLEDNDPYKAHLQAIKASCFDELKKLYDKDKLIPKETQVQTQCANVKALAQRLIEQYPLKELLNPNSNPAPFFVSGDSQNPVHDIAPRAATLHIANTLLLHSDRADKNRNTLYTFLKGKSVKNEMATSIRETLIEEQKELVAKDPIKQVKKHIIENWPASQKRAELITELDTIENTLKGNAAQKFTRKLNDQLNTSLKKAANKYDLPFNKDGKFKFCITNNALKDFNTRHLTSNKAPALLSDDKTSKEAALEIIEELMLNYHNEPLRTAGIKNPSERASKKDIKAFFDQLKGNVDADRTRDNTLAPGESKKMKWQNVAAGLGTAAGVGLVVAGASSNSADKKEQAKAREEALKQGQPEAKRPEAKRKGPSFKTVALIGLGIVLTGFSALVLSGRINLNANRQR